MSREETRTAPKADPGPAAPDGEGRISVGRILQIALTRVYGREEIAEIEKAAAAARSSAGKRGSRRPATGRRRKSAGTG